MFTVQVSIVVLVFLALVLMQITIAGSVYFHHMWSKRQDMWETHIDQMFKMAPNGMCLADVAGDPLKYNQSLCAMLGYDVHKIDPSDKAEGCPIHPAIYKYVKDASHFTTPYEHKFIHADGSDVWCLLTATELLIDGVPLILINFVDITSRKEDEKTIFHLAYYDSLTQLPNRTFFVEHAPRMIAGAGDEKRRLAFFLVDIDDFKRVNDNFGHHAGDQMLQQIADRLAKLIQHRCEDETICRCFAARLGGDEFVLIVEDIENAEQARTLADKIFTAFETPVQLEDQQIVVNLSVGIALFPYDGSSSSSLLKSADLALYTAKDKGKNRYYFHELSMNTRLEEHMQYENALHYFIDTQDFDVHYQPIFHLEKGVLCGAEALFRSNDRRYDNMNLERLIGVAEETGLIIELGNQITRRVCSEWFNTVGQDPTKVVSINLSMRQLDEPTIVKDILDILYETGLPHEQLNIEITETAFTHNFHENVRKLSKLQNTGISIAIDDFGKGYSSMSYLQQLPVSKLKIDIAFIRKIAEDEKSAEIVKVIIILAKTLGLTCVAEGVETEEQKQILLGLGCEEIQGYLSGAAMPIKKLVELADS